MIAAALSIALLLFGRMLGDLLLKPLLILLPKVRQDMAFLLMYLRFIGVLLLTAIYCAWAEKEVWKSFFSRRQGGMPGNTASHFCLGIVAGAGIIGFCILIAFLHGDAALAANGFHVAYLLGGLLCVLIQAGAEEMVFRGYLLGVTRQNREDWDAVLISAGIFAAMHLLNILCFCWFLLPLTHFILNIGNITGMAVFAAFYFRCCAGVNGVPLQESLDGNRVSHGMELCADVCVRPACCRHGFREGNFSYFCCAQQLIL